MELLATDNLRQSLIQFGDDSKNLWDRGVAFITMTSNLLDTTLYAVGTSSIFAEIIINLLKDYGATILTCAYNSAFGTFMIPCLIGEKQDTIILKNMDKSIVDC